MTPEQIRESLFLGEGQRIEFNASTRNLDALGKTVCGFLNASGGYLICGVNDKGDVIGIEKAGRGSVLMVQQCRENGLPPPSWVSDSRLGVTVTFLAPETTPEVTTDVTTEVHRLLQHLEGEMTRQALQHAMGLKNAEHFRKTYLLPALEQGLIEMTIPDKPKSSKQQYRKTAAGRNRLENKMTEKEKTDGLP